MTHASIGGSGQGRPGGIDGVIARMDALAGALPAGDGVRAFTEMYLATTREVAAGLDRAQFVDREFMDRLDVHFADLFFGALELHEADPTRAPRCWSALIEAREQPGTSPLQFALAGMNAHIGYDLPRALVTTTIEFGGNLDDAGRRADFLTINEILGTTQPRVKESLLAGLLADLDDALGGVDDRAGLWAIEQAREMAWGSAHALWSLRGTRAAAVYERGIDRVVEIGCRAVLGL